MTPKSLFQSNAALATVQQGKVVIKTAVNKTVCNSRGGGGGGISGDDGGGYENVKSYIQVVLRHELLISWLLIRTRGSRALNSSIPRTMQNTSLYVSDFLSTYANTCIPTMSNRSVHLGTK